MKRRSMSRAYGMTKKQVRSIGVLVCMAVGLSACTFSEHLADAAVDYNTSLERANNEILLRNIVRASLDHPLHFSGISILRGNIETSATVSGEFPFGGDAASEFLIKPSAAIGTSPSVEIVPLDTQEFYRGLISPVNDGLLVLLLEEQSWDEKLLFNLLVDQVHINGCRYDNDPRKVKKIKAFQEIADLFTGVKTSVKSEPLGPVVPAAGATLPNVIAAAKEGYEVKEVSAGLRLYRQEASSLLVFGKAKSQPTVPISAPKAIVAPDDGGLQFRLYAGPVPSSTNEVDANSPGDAKPPVATKLEDCKPLTEIKSVKGTKETKETGVVLRSALGVIRYLGQFAKNSPVVSFRPISVHSDGAAAAEVRVAYQGRTYALKKEEGGHSMNTLALLSQLITINKSAKDLPATPSVVSVGG